MSEMHIVNSISEHVKIPEFWSLSRTAVLEAFKNPEIQRGFL